RGLTVARPVAVGILMRMQVDAAVLDCGVGDDRIAQLHRRSATATFAASLTGAGAALPPLPLPCNQRREREHPDDKGRRHRDKPMLTYDTHGHILRWTLLRCRGGREVRIVDVPPDVQPVHVRAHRAEAVREMRWNEEDVAHLGWRRHARALDA